jgi:carbamoyl-phosphate synthase large subunit
VDKYIRGTEIEVDAVSDGEDILIPGIMEHVERTGVHSGDSITVYPYFTLESNTVEKLKKYTQKIAKALKISGLMNIQYVFDGKDVYVIEVNPRASRTIPILSKVTNVPMVKIAVEIMLGKKLGQLPYGTGIMKNKNFYAVKVPVFSNEKLADVDTYLGPEMKSTGEVLGIDCDFKKAIYKGFVSSGINIPVKGSLYVSLKDIDKEEALNLIKQYQEFGFNIYGSKETSEFLDINNLLCKYIAIKKVFQLIRSGEINIIINTPTLGNNLKTDGFKIRRKAAEFRVPLFTCIDTARQFLTAIKVEADEEEITYRTINEYLNL